MAAANIEMDKPRRISPPTIRGEANTPLIIILHASSVYTWRLDIVPARRARIQNGGAEGRRFPRVPVDLT
jgi:hypothetical protein